MNSGRSLRNASPNVLLALFLVGLITPPIAWRLASEMINTTIEANIQMIQTDIQEVDNAINTGNVTRVLTDKSPCPEQEYYQDGSLVARDTFSPTENPNKCQLSTRWYYKDGVIEAKDLFKWGDNEGIEKHREYYNSNGVVFLREDFIRGGHPLQKEYLSGNDYEPRRNSMESPLPPFTMLYVYFYR